MASSVRTAFERTADVGDGDAGALALALRDGVTSQAWWALAAQAVHVAAAAPDRMVEVFDAAAAGWTRAAAPPPRPPAADPLPISSRWWTGLWNIAAPPAEAMSRGYPQQMMELAGELDPRINARMATAALEFPGLAEAAAQPIPEPYEIERLSKYPVASLGYALSQELLRPGSPAADPYWTSVVPYLRHMPTPLNYVNVAVIQNMGLWSMVAGYTSRTLDRMALGGFLMGHVGHHYSALATAVTLTTAAVTPPEAPATILDCILRGWLHGRRTPPLAKVDWEPLWPLRIDEARAALGVAPFRSSYATAPPAPTGWTPRVV